MKKKLYRSTRDRKLAGVLGGLADFTGLDASLLRVLYVILVLFGIGSPILIYLVWIFVVPDEGDVIR